MLQQQSEPRKKFLLLKDKICHTMPLPSFTDPDVENSDSRETKSLVQDNYSICETQGKISRETELTVAQHHIEVSSRVSSFSIIDSTLVSNSDIFVLII